MNYIKLQRALGTKFLRNCPQFYERIIMTYAVKAVRLHVFVFSRRCVARTKVHGVAKGKILYDLNNTKMLFCGSYRYDGSGHFRGKKPKTAVFC